jgi:hypothetical protein
VATFLGTLLALFWPAGIAACLTWLLVAAVSRISSLSALVAAVLVAGLDALLGRPEAVLLCILLAALILWRHRDNIRRPRAAGRPSGTEPKIGKKILDARTANAKTTAPPNTVPHLAIVWPFFSRHLQPMDFPRHFPGRKSS